MKMPPLKKAPPEFTGAACEMMLSDTSLQSAAAGYAALVLAPPLLVRRLRARGDESAGARDFECACPTSPDTDRPHCEERFADCRFAGERDGEKPPRLSPSRQIFFDALVDIAYAYKNASPAERADMLAFMEKVVGERLARIQKSRQAGKYLLERAGEGPEAE